MTKSKIFLAVMLLAIGVTSASAQNVTVSDEMTIKTNAGEAQSTVVPPGINKKCELGRFLVTNDRKRPPAGVVMGRNLDQTGGTPISSKFGMGTLATNYNRDDLTKSNYSFGTNDHDLLTLSNGDVLYITGAFTRMPLAPPGGRPLPIYMNSLFENTFRNGACAQLDANDNCTSGFNFGPKARSTVLVWRSSDCGENFEYVAEMDPARFGGATCALPQFRIKPGCKTGECRDTTAPWDMGGTDGQLSRVDPANDRVYMTFQCVGYLPDDSGKTNPKLDPNKKINKTLVTMFDPANNSWKGLGYIDQAAWRFSVIPTGNELDFGYASSLLTGKKNAQGNYVFDSTGSVAPKGFWSWMGEWNFKDSNGNTNIPVNLIGSNVLAVPLIARTPDPNTLMLAFPDNFTSSGWGYRVAFYDRAAGTVTDAVDSDSILPAKPNADNMVYHLAVADPGSGPVLLYWTDLDSATKTVTVRGRLIIGKNKFTDDFSINQASGKPASFTLAGNEYWYGDYHTAGGYVKKFAQTAGQGEFVVTLASTTRYDYYPMWVEPGSTLRYAKVEYAVKTSLLTTASQVKAFQVNERTISPERWRPQPPPVELRLIRRQTRPSTQERDTRETIRRPAAPIILRPRP
jgi:hypothetical protein